MPSEIDCSSQEKKSSLRFPKLLRYLSIVFVLPPHPQISMLYGCLAWVGERAQTPETKIFLGPTLKFGGRGTFFRAPCGIHPPEQTIFKFRRGWMDFGGILRVGAGGCNTPVAPGGWSRHLLELRPVCFRLDSRFFLRSMDPFFDLVS